MSIARIAHRAVAADRQRQGQNPPHALQVGDQGFRETQGFLHSSSTHFICRGRV
jgi:hypothetical protein